jgi:succinate dehydrogenase / fumarate reductase cytochrome b subunit
LKRERNPFVDNWLVRGLSTTVGQKLLMGATGLLLCIFLVGHLAGNLLMFKGPQAYNEYAEFLHKNELLPVAEAALLVLFVLHIVMAFVTTRENTSARPIGYAMKESKLDAPWLGPLVRPSSTMFITGIVVLVFLIVHLSDMRFAHWSQHLSAFSRRFFVPEGETPFAHAVRVLHDPISATVYIIGSLFLGWHVSHGLQSAFRSLGFAHPKYSTFLYWLSIVFGFVVAVGFAALPIWFKWGSP